MRLLPYALALLGVLLVGYATLTSGSAHAPDNLSTIGADSVEGLHCTEDSVIGYDSTQPAPYPLACIHVDALPLAQHATAPRSRSRGTGSACALAARAVRFQLLELATSSAPDTMSTTDVQNFAHLQYSNLEPCGSPTE